MIIERPYFDNYIKDPLGAFKKKDKFLGRRKYRHGEVRIIHPVIIESPSYIGPDCTIGPFSYIREGTYLEGNNHIGNSSEVKNSIVLEGTNLPHFNYVGDSIIGKNCNLGAGTKTANLRLDEKEVKIGKKYSGLRKLGVIMGDNVKTGINVSLYPGEIFESYTFIYNDIRKNRIVKKVDEP